jgi:hypothetical protein
VNLKSQYTVGKKNLDPTEKILRYELVFIYSRMQYANIYMNPLVIHYIQCSMLMHLVLLNKQMVLWIYTLLLLHMPLKLIFITL